jgi:hypothetical protein
VHGDDNARLEQIACVFGLADAHCEVIAHGKQGYVRVVQVVDDFMSLKTAVSPAW